MLPVWKKFELAIANFIAALDPQAKVFHDVLLPDKHTGTPRQRDVWIETKILQHYTIKIYVSCKHKKRKLNQQDIDAFYGELLSSGAHKGIIYSFSGFGDKAIKKAKSLGICCCKLYQNDPPDLPESLIFPHVYCCQSKLSILLLEPFDPNWNLKTWNDLLEVKVLNSDGYKSILDIIINLCHEQERMVVKRITPQQIFPSNWALELKIPPIKPHIKPI